MSKIKCNQEKCKYNNCEHCMLDEIKVDIEANCESYKEGIKENNLDFEFASFERLNNEVKCKATECLYNKDKRCVINHLNIGKEKSSAPCIDYEETK